MTGFVTELVEVCEHRRGRGIYELAAMFQVPNDWMLRALWEAERRGQVVPMVVDGYVWWFLVPGA